MANTTIHFKDAVAVIKSQYIENQAYKYGDISSTLIKAFPDINKSQVSGLITRFVDFGYFKKNKEPGSRYDYIFQSETTMDKSTNKVILGEKNNIHEIVEKEIEDLIDRLNKLKTNINTSEDFIYLQSKIESLNKLIKK